MYRTVHIVWWWWWSSSCVCVWRALWEEGGEGIVLNSMLSTHSTLSTRSARGRHRAWCWLVVLPVVWFCRTREPSAV